MFVRSFAEKAWVDAGCIDISKIDGDVSSGRMVEFSPSSLLRSVPSLARSSAARLNGAKGGRPRKSL